MGQASVLMDSDRTADSLSPEHDTSELGYTLRSSSSRDGDHSDRGIPTMLDTFELSTATDTSLLSRRDEDYIPQGNSKSCGDRWVLPNENHQGNSELPHLETPTESRREWKDRGRQHCETGFARPEATISSNLSLIAGSHNRTRKPISTQAYETVKKHQTLSRLANSWPPLNTAGQHGDVEQKKKSRRHRQTYPRLPTINRTKTERSLDRETRSPPALPGLLLVSENDVDVSDHSSSRAWAAGCSGVSSVGGFIHRHHVDAPMGSTGSSSGASSCDISGNADTYWEDNQGGIIYSSDRSSRGLPAPPMTPSGSLPAIASLKEVN